MTSTVARRGVVAPDSQSEMVSSDTPAASASSLRVMRSKPRAAVMCGPVSWIWLDKVRKSPYLLINRRNPNDFGNPDRIAISLRTIA